MNFQDLFQKDTARDSFIVTITTLINIISGGLFFIIVPRILGPADFGLFSAITTTSVLLVNLANFGIDTGILRFASKNSKENSKYLSIAFKSYILIGFITTITGIGLSPLISKFLGHPELTSLFQIAFLFTIFLLMSNFYIAGLQARGMFKEAGILNISSNIVRIVLLAVALLFIKVNLVFITLLFFSVTIVSTIFGKVLLPFKFVQTSSEALKSFHKYNFWIALSLIIPSIPFDNYILLKSSNSIQAGIYAAPFKLLTFSYQFGGNFTRVLATRYSTFDTNEKVRIFSLKTMPIIFVCAGALILLGFLGNYVLNILFGPSFQSSLIIFRVLIVGFIFFFASTVPTSIVLYYFGKSQITFITTILQVSIFVLILMLTVPRSGALGAAVAFSTSQAASFLFITAYTLQKISKK